MGTIFDRGVLGKKKFLVPTRNRTLLRLAHSLDAMPTMRSPHSYMLAIDSHTVLTSSIHKFDATLGCLSTSSE